MHFEIIPGCEDPLARREISVTNVGGGIGPMEIHVVRPHVVLTTLEDLGTDTAKESASNGLDMFG